jgi:hypothetical protein
MLVSPDPSDAPSADSQDDSSSTTPSNGGETETNTTGGSGTAPATGGDSGAKKDEKSDRDSTTTTGGSDAGSTIPAPTDPALDPLPPGTVRQIESGRRTLEELPRGLKKRLPPDVIAPAA